MPKQKIDSLPFELSSETEKFFNEIASCKIDDLVDFLDNLEKKEHNRKWLGFSEENLNLLLKKINQFSSELSPRHISKIFNSLSGLGYSKKECSTLEIAKIIERANAQIEKFNNQDLTYILEGFARFNYDKSEINFNSENYAQQLNKKYHGLNFHETTTALHALAKLGYKSETASPSLYKSIEKLADNVKRIITTGANIEPHEIAKATHSLAKIGMFEKLFEMQSEINDALRNAELTDNSAFSLLQSQMNSQLFFGQNFFTEELIEQISTQSSAQEVTVSALQKMVENNLPLRNYAVTSEAPLYQFNQITTRSADILYSNAYESFVIEVDGPSHFTADLKPNSDTLHRDATNEAILDQMRLHYPERKFHYLKISVNEMSSYLDGNGALKPKEEINLKKFLEKKLEGAKAKTAQEFANDLDQIEVEIINEQPACEISVALSGADLDENAEIKKEPINFANLSIEKIFVQLQQAHTKKTINGILDQIGEKINQIGAESDEALIHLAIKDQRFDLASALLQKGANIDLQNSEGETSLHLAAKNNYSDFVEKLFKAGADLNLKNHCGKTAFELAIENDCAASARILVSTNLAKERLEELSKEKGNSETGLIIKTKLPDDRTITFLLGATNPQIIDRFCQKIAHTSSAGIAIFRALTEKNPPRYDIILGLLQAGTSLLDVDKSTRQTLFEQAQNAEMNIKDEITAHRIKSGEFLPADESEMLRTAIIENNFVIVEAFTARSSIDFSDDHWLALAAELEPSAENLKMIQLLIDAGSNPASLESEKINHLLEQALDKDNVELVCALSDSTNKVPATIFDKAIKLQSSELLEVALNKTEISREEIKNALQESVDNHTDWKIFNRLFEHAIDKNLKISPAEIELPLTECNYLLQQCIRNKYNKTFKPFYDHISTTHPDPLLSQNLICETLEHNNVEIFQLLLERKNIKVDNQSPYLLHLAARYGRLDILKIALKHLKDPSIIDQCLDSQDAHLTPMYMALVGNHKDVVETLIEHGAKTTFSSKDSSIIVASLAHKTGPYDAVKYLVERGDINPNIMNPEAFDYLVRERILKPVASDEKGSESPMIMRAMQQTNKKVLRNLIEMGADVNFNIFKEGKCTYPSALYLATDQNDLATVKILLEAGANASLPDKKNILPIHLATMSDHMEVTEVLDLLIKKDPTLVNAPDDDGHTPLYLAAQNNKLSAVKMLVSNGADVTLRNSEGFSPIHVSTHPGSEEVLKFLIAQNPQNVHLKNNQQQTPLHGTVFSNNPKSAQILIDAGADINAVDIQGATPLFFAAQNNKLSVVKMLVKNGADVTLRNSKGFSPIHASTSPGYEEILKIFIALDPQSVHLKNNKQQTVLFGGVLLNNLKSIKILIDAGADVNAVDTEGGTPLSYACLKILETPPTESASLKEIVSALIKAGANPNINEVTKDAFDKFNQQPSSQPKLSDSSNFKGSQKNSSKKTRR